MEITVTMERTYLPNTRIELINPDIQRGRVHHALFDFDGTSLSSAKGGKT